MAAEARLFRSFLLGAIVVTLTAGCVWGATNLHKIGSERDYFAVPLDWTLAHAHAQVQGLVGLFVMGFAYAVVPRTCGTQLASVRAAWASFWLMCIGIVGHTVAQTWSHGPGMLPLGLAAGVLETASAITALWLVMGAIQTAPPEGRERLVAAPLIVTGMIAFVVQTVAGIGIFYLLATAQGEEALVPIIVRWIPAFRDIQIWGFAVVALLGLALQVIAPAFHTERVPRRSDAETVHDWLLLSLVVAVCSGLLVAQLQIPAFALGSIGAYVGFFAVASMAAVRSGVFSRAETPDRSLKFLRAAFVWLIVAVVMLNGMAPYNRATGQPFSHAYLGSVRHALTVGFILMLIVGLSARFAPELAGVEAHSLGMLWAPFVLINVGNTIRVACQISTDFTQALFPLMGMSGFLEVAGLLIWMADIVRVIARRQRVRPTLATLEEARSVVG